MRFTAATVLAVASVVAANDMSQPAGSYTPATTPTMTPVASSTPYTGGGSSSSSSSSYHHHHHHSSSSSMYMPPSGTMSHHSHHSHHTPKPSSTHKTETHRHYTSSGHHHHHHHSSSSAYPSGTPATTKNHPHHPHHPRPSPTSSAKHPNHEYPKPSGNRNSTTTGGNGKPRPTQPMVVTGDAPSAGVELAAVMAGLGAVFVFL